MISVIGLGYVGLPLAIGFAQAGYQVTGIDTDPHKVAGIQAGVSHVQDICSAELQQVVHSGHLRATQDFGVLAEMDSVSICVPTPLSKTKDPDISYIVVRDGSDPYALTPWAIDCAGKYDVPGDDG